MEDRRKLGYQGPVWKVSESWRGTSEFTRELEFDRDGTLIGTARPVVEVNEGQGGARVETQRFAGTGAWSMEGLNEVAFYTRGAALAETIDEGDRVLEQSTYFGDLLHQRIVCTYNEHGDVATFESTVEEPYRMEYEYDQWGNWTRKVVRHPAGTAEGRRSITYYD